MLEAVKLNKTYKPKKGVPVKALKNINLRFDEKGMVFLLGKSGSGKSTLLNMLGGLDKYDRDGGELIIKGVSSKDFKQTHFDSYRNTYVGFIFQEYNILEEFTVGANIGIALELQGIKADSDKINAILSEVGLEGYGQRRPNELSGGQKQRVAIARALVKNPQIIMADEPTGALDSSTGKQVFDTLKKLSETRLVIVVSHDREFSEKYADRIIELEDGRIISDVELNNNSYEIYSTSKLIYSNNIIEIPEKYQLTDEDRVAINEYIRSFNSGNLSLKLSDKGTVKFIETDQSKIKTFESSKFKLIKSRLPLKSAFKIGASGLKYKKIRLTFTVLLSLISFTLFGIADTFGCYNKINSAADSLVDSKITAASFTKMEKEYYSSDNDKYFWLKGLAMSADELSEIESRYGIKVNGVYQPVNSNDISFQTNIDKLDMYGYIYSDAFSGITESSHEELADKGYKLMAGRYPKENIPYEDDQEIAVTSVIYETFKNYGYKDADGNIIKINSPEDLIDKVLYMGARNYIIKGIYDCNFDFDRYKLLQKDEDELSNADIILLFILSQELDTEKNMGMSYLMFTAKGFINESIENGLNIKKTDKYYYADFINENLFYSCEATRFLNIEQADKNKIIWFNKDKTTLEKNEILLPVSGGIFEIINENSEAKNEKYNMTEWIEYFRDVDTIDIYGENKEKFTVTPVGFYDNTDMSINGEEPFLVIEDGFAKEILGEGDKVYSHAVGTMPKDKENVKKLVEKSFDESYDTVYYLSNPVIDEINTISEVLEILSKVFLYIGIGFALFSSMLLSNFISTSISYKKQEIGILRAIGSRSNDVFRIFFAESFIIAMINFVLSAVSVGTITAIINSVIRNETSILVTILSFSVRQIALLFVISISVAFLASFIPVKKIASKRPIDAIKNR